MKRSEMNAHQREAFDFIISSMSDYIGGYENTLQDCKKDSEDYKEAYEFLHQGHEALRDLIYDEVMSLSDKGMAKHLRFAGKEFILERISKRLEKWGY